MQQREVEVAIIGAGSAGLSAWHAASQHSDSVVLIEGGEYGTTCARVGCMPSKLLIAAAEAAHQARDAGGFGIKVSGVEVDGRAVMARLKAERDGFVGRVFKSMQRIPEANRLQGHARFEDPHTLRVGEHTRLKARNIVIATGSRASWPKMFDAAGDRLIITDHVFEWDDLPESIAVFGPGVIGLELGQALHRLGVRLRVFGVGGALGPFRDDKVREAADATFNEEFYVDPDARVEKIERDGDAVVITFIERNSGETLTERFDYLLAAASNAKGPGIDPGLSGESGPAGAQPSAARSFSAAAARSADSAIGRFSTWISLIASSGVRWTCTWGTSRPTISIPTRWQGKACLIALAMRRDTVIRC